MLLALLCACGSGAGTDPAASYAAEIVCSGSGAQIQGAGAAVSGGEVLISKGGVYRLSGELNGCVTIDCAGEVELVLDGVTVRGEGWAIYARDCERLTLTLSDGTVNALSQTAAADENGVCLESKAPVTVRGGGSLALSAAAIGLRCTDELTVEGGCVAVNAGGLGVKVKGEGAAAVSGGVFTVNAGEDGLKATAVTVSGGETILAAAERGMDVGDFALLGGAVSVTSGDDGIRAEETLAVSGGTLSVTAGCDGLQGDGGVAITGGELTIVCAGGGGNAISRRDEGGMGGPGFGTSSASGEMYEMPEYSCKAIKSDGAIAISGGTLMLNSADDTIHAAGAIEIAGAAISICSSDDAIHSDTDLTINSGRIYVSDCFEGLEAATITINGGDVDIYSVNDGINASSGSGGFGFGGDGAVFTMNGGEVDIFVTGTSSNLGDGIDSNGAIYINGGWLTASTDGSTMENGIDSGSSIVITGGILAASGNSGMQETPSTYSTQCSAVLNVSAGVSAGTECVVTDAQGNVLMTYTPTRWASCIVLSHPDFTIGETYTLTAGTQVKTFTFTSVSYSENGFGFGGPGGGPGGRMF